MSGAKEQLQFVYDSSIPVCNYLNKSSYYTLNSHSIQPAQHAAQSILIIHNALFISPLASSKLRLSLDSAFSDNLKLGGRPNFFFNSSKGSMSNNDRIVFNYCSKTGNFNTGYTLFWVSSLWLTNSGAEEISLLVVPSPSAFTDTS